MATTTTISPAVERIFEVIRRCVGSHPKLDEESLLELAEKLAFIIRSKHQGNIQTQSIAMFSVMRYLPDRVRTQHRLVFVHETEVVVAGIQMVCPVGGPISRRKELLDGFYEAVDETITRIID